MKKLVFVCLVLLSLLAVLPVSGQDSQIEITFVHIFGGEQDSRVQVIQEIAADFMAANPNIVVNIVSTSTDYTELFNAALLSAEQGTAPHIVQVEEGLTQLAADSGFFVPVGDLASPEQLASLDDYLPTVLGYYRIGETLWSIPWNSSNPVLYYNRGMFEAAGLDPDSPPTTFAELLAVCEAIANANIEGLTSCANWPMVSWFPEQWVTMQNGLIANNDNGRSARATEMLYDSPEMLKVVTWWKEMADLGYYSYSGTPNDYNGEGMAFLTKKSAITINSTAGLTLFQRFSQVQQIDLGVAALPTPDEDATNGVTIGGASLWITAGHPQEELQAANDFIFFLTNPENDIKWHQGTGYFPNRQSSIETLTANGWFGENPFFGIAINQLAESAGNIANEGAVIGPSTEVRSILVEAIQSVVDGGEDPAVALAAAKTRADAVLADYNILVGG